MKASMLALGLILVSGSAMAADVQIFKEASITVCSADTVQCAPKLITASGARYFLDQSYAKAFLKRHGHMSRSDNKTIEVQEVMGVAIKERGHFPNPTALFDIVKVISIIE